MDVGNIWDFMFACLVVDYQTPTSQTMTLEPQAAVRVVPISLLLVHIMRSFLTCVVWPYLDPMINLTYQFP